MKDRIVQYPNRYKFTPVAGTADTYDLTAVPGTVTEAGTALNKAALLTDTVAALLGLSGDPTVNDALNALLGRAQVAVGTYTGTGKTSRTVSTPFNPQFVLLWGRGADYGYVGICFKTTATSFVNDSTNNNWKNASNSTYICTTSGFEVSTNDVAAQYWSTNITSTTYYYVAIG